LETTAPEAALYEAAMEKLLPDQYGLVDFGPWLTKLGNQYGVTASFSFQGNPSAPPAGTLGSAPFSLTAQGDSIQSLTNFLKDIESQAPGYLLSISSFDLSNSANPSLTAQGTLFFR
jgi:hypothetical protein